MAAYPENTGGIISAIQACIVAAGGTLTQEYPKNTGGIIAALVTLQTAIGSGGSGSSLSVELTVGEDVSKGDALYIQSDGKVYKADADDTREKATVLGFAKEDAVAEALVDVVTRGMLENTGGYAATTQYFLTGSPGVISATPATTAGSFSVAVGEGVSNDKIDIKISTPVLLS
jgi:hypothetical protein|tara:strand:+ start:1628 stop:2149 length:522 start_codon:yes stop_codon:yes gene_type:complete